APQPAVRQHLAAVGRGRGGHRMAARAARFARRAASRHRGPAGTHGRTRARATVHRAQAARRVRDAARGARVSILPRRDRPGQGRPQPVGPATRAFSGAGAALPGRGRAGESRDRREHALPSNVTSGVAALLERAAFAHRTGCRGCVVNALPAGLDALRAVAATGLAVMSHPSLAGAFFGADHGIAPPVLLGDLFRVAGSDAVIYPNVEGRFTLSEATCDAINARLRAPLGSVRPSFPVPAGGIDVARVPHWLDRYGADTIFLVGGSLYAQPDLVAAARRLVEAVRARSR